MFVTVVELKSNLQTFSKAKFTSLALMKDLRKTNLSQAIDFKMWMVSLQMLSTMMKFLRISWNGFQSNLFVDRKCTISTVVRMNCQPYAPLPSIGDPPRAKRRR